MWHVLLDVFKVTGISNDNGTSVLQLGKRIRLFDFFDSRHFYAMKCGIMVIKRFINFLK